MIRVNIWVELNYLTDFKEATLNLEPHNIRISLIDPKTPGHVSVSLSIDDFQSFMDRFDPNYDFTLETNE